MGILLTDGKTKTKYVYQPYPKFIEHADGRTCVVADMEAHRAAGEGWTPVEGDPVWVPTEFGAVLATATVEPSTDGTLVLKPKRGRPRKGTA